LKVTVFIAILLIISNFSFQSSAGSSSVRQSQPLISVSLAKFTFNNPINLFNCQALGQNVTTTYVFRSGGFYFNNSLGQIMNFSLPLVAVSGIVNTSLILPNPNANSTTVIYSLSTAIGSHVFSTTISFSHFRAATCGYTSNDFLVSIHGNLSGATAINSTINLKLNNPEKANVLLSSNALGVNNQISFGLLGFSWNDALNYDPSWNNLTSTISFQIGSSFKIDPVTVGTTTSSVASAAPNQRKIFFADTRFWFFYSDGTNEVWSTSLNGVTWSSTQVVRTGAPGHLISIWYDRPNNNIYYASTAASNTQFQYRFGTLNSDGTITWTIAEKAVTLANARGGSAFPYIFADSMTNIWVTLTDRTTGSDWFIQAYRCVTICGTATNFVLQKEIDTGTLATSAIWSSNLLELTNSSVYAEIYGREAQTITNPISVVTTVNGGSTWSSPLATVDIGALAIGSVVQSTNITSKNSVLLNFIGSSQFETEYTLGNSRWATDMKDTSGALQSSFSKSDSTAASSFSSFIWYASNATAVIYGTSTGYNGLNAIRPLLSSTSDNSIVTLSLSTSYDVTNATCLFEAGWVNGSASPFNLRFAFHQGCYSESPSYNLKFKEQGLRVFGTASTFGTIGSAFAIVLVLSFGFFIIALRKRRRR